VTCRRGGGGGCSIIEEGRCCWRDGGRENVWREYVEVRGEAEWPVVFRGMLLSSGLGAV
jgi:hypothetical protein